MDPQTKNYISMAIPKILELPSNVSRMGPPFSAFKVHSCNTKYTVSLTTKYDCARSPYQPSLQGSHCRDSPKDM